MKSRVSVYLIMAVLGSTLLLGACEEEGPAEEAGETIDQAVEETKEEVQESKEKLEETIKD